MTSDVIDAIEDSIQTKLKLKNESETINKIGQLVSNSINSGGKVVMFGNDSSATDAQHIVAELVGRYQIDRKGLAAVALTTNTSILTAIGNDFSYDEVFSRQIEALVDANDIVIGISTVVTHKMS